MSTSPTARFFWQIMMLVSLTMAKPITQEQENLYNGLCPIFNGECSADIEGVAFGVTQGLIIKILFMFHFLCIFF